MMKKLALMGCVVLLAAGAAFGGLLNEEPGELSVSGLYWFPGDGDFNLFESGYGAQISYREWFSFPWGVGVHLGLAQWQVDNGSTAYKYDQLTRYDGDALLLPIGASLYFNLIDWDNWNLIFGTGLEYVIVESSVDVFNNEPDQQRRQDVDIGGALLWNLEAEYEYMLSEKAYIMAGAGYQVDVVRADTDINDVDVRDTSLRGAFLRLGCKFLF